MSERHESDEREDSRPPESTDKPAFTPEPASEQADSPKPEPSAKPAPTPTTVSKAKRKPAVEDSAPSKISGATVVLSALVYQAGMRNSASVATVQDRLSELGYAGVRGDKRGWMSDCTVDALEKFQESAGLEVTGVADRKTVESLLSGVDAQVTD